MLYTISNQTKPFISNSAIFTPHFKPEQSATNLDAIAQIITHIAQRDHHPIEQVARPQQQ